MLPEQWSALVQKQLSVVADEICRILERMMSEHETEVSSHQHKLLKTETSVHRTDRLPPSGLCREKAVSPEQQKCEQSKSPSRVQKTSAPLQFKDASTETDPGLIHGKPSHLHQNQSAGKGTITMMVRESRGQHCSLPPSDQEVLLSKYPEGRSKDGRRRILQRLRQNQGADCCTMCGRPFHKGSAEEEMRKCAKKSQTTGQSCCRVCGKFFWYKRSFLKHILQHEQGSGQCGVCGKHLDSADSLKVHLQTHNEENSCRDQMDDKQSSAECSDAKSDMADSDEDQREHEETERDKDEAKEGSFLRKTTKFQTLDKSEGVRSEDCKDFYPLKYCCKVCGKSFCYRASFLKHVQEDENDTDLCGVCGEHFKTQESLRLHLQTYIRTNECEVCGKHFDGLKQLEMHMRTHTGEKPYICTVCGKAFAQNGNLMGHMRVHTGEKPYVCSVCTQSFSFKEYMMAHMRIHTGEKPFLCSDCGKGFRQRGTLKTHMMIHTGESTHRCVICDKKFYKSGALKVHMRTHTGEKPYLCNVCGQRFAAGSSLTTHGCPWSPADALLQDF